MLYCCLNEPRGSPPLKTMTASFKVDAGGLTIRHTEDQLLSLVATFIPDFCIVEEN